MVRKVSADMSHFCCARTSDAGNDTRRSREGAKKGYNNVRKVAHRGGGVKEGTQHGCSIHNRCLRTHVWMLHVVCTG